MNLYERRHLAEKLAEAAMIVGGFDPSVQTLMKPLFSLGRTYATSGVTEWAEANRIDLTQYLRRHHCVDGGDLDQEDKQANETALAHGGRIFSSYLIGSRKIFVITEADRSSTTILFAEEY